jgi:hypothetical protein
VRFYARGYPGIRHPFAKATRLGGKKPSHIGRKSLFFQGGGRVLIMRAVQRLFSFAIRSLRDDPSNTEGSLPGGELLPISASRFLCFAARPIVFRAIPGA